ncbi:DUF86 [Desulfonema limicola]|uniref:DUF86 n=1 Tax=Desulfonema limicola TaxID=45656 RepID=A0A975BD45_9BACT|nr:DUF86 domain-containing protein [Desulfonema limicola]QTA83073.1 DUF86 [Desulfonema limicola]
MQKDDNIRILHMLDSAKEAVGFVNNINRAALDKDRKLVLALVKSIEIVGEAAARISDETCKKYPQIPWQNIVGMRNRLVHGYFAINLDILWKTTIEDLPPLIIELKKIVSMFDNNKDKNRKY